MPTGGEVTPPQGAPHHIGSLSSLRLCRLVCLEHPRCCAGVSSAMASTDEVITVDGVQCKSQKGGMLTVGVNVPKPLRFPIKRKADDVATCNAVREHRKFAAAAAALNGSGGSSSSAPPPPLPPPAATSAPSVKIGTRELGSLRELNTAGPAMQIVSTVPAADSSSVLQQPRAIELAALTGMCWCCSYCGVHADSHDWLARIGMTMDDIALRECDGCRTIYCDAVCTRRGRCGLCQLCSVDEVAAGLEALALGTGCQCACCARVTSCAVCESITRGGEGLLWAGAVHADPVDPRFYCNHACARQDGGQC
jgi:hypothetical protein